MDPFGNEDIAWLHSQVRSSLQIIHSILIVRFPPQLSGHAHGLSGIYERISMAIRRLEDEKSALQKRVEELERDDNPTSEARRLREENATLRAKVASTTKEKLEVTRERDVLLRKLNGVKQLILDPTVRRAYALLSRVMLTVDSSPHSSTTKPPATTPNLAHQQHQRPPCAPHVIPLTASPLLPNAPSLPPSVSRPPARTSQSP